jgi:GT2 family glycosyltransferase
LKASIIFPVFNGLSFLADSLAGIINQTLDDYEVLILDDASTDDSYNYISSISNSRIRVFRNDTNKGLFFSLNKLIANAIGDIVILWSQDDVMLPKALESIVNFHAKYPEIAFTYCGRKYIDQNGNLFPNQNENIDPTPTTIHPGLHLKIAWFTGSIAGNISALAFKRQIFDKYGLFKKDFFYSADFEYQIRVGLSESIGRIKDVLFFQRLHKNQLSAQLDKSIFQLKEDLYVFDIMFNHPLNIQLIEFATSCMKWKRSNYYLSVFFKLVRKRKFVLAFNYFSILYNNPLIEINPFRFVSYFFGYRKPIKLF